MLGALIIVFREVFEAGLIVGIVLAVTRGIAGRNRWIGFGIAGGVGGLFLYGIGAAGGGSGASIALGGAIGLLLGALVCMLTYLGLVRIPAKPLFRVTTILIALLAAGMAAQATAFLAQANWVTA